MIESSIGSAELDSAWAVPVEGSRFWELARQNDLDGPPAWAIQARS